MPLFRQNRVHLWVWMVLTVFLGACQPEEPIIPQPTIPDQALSQEQLDIIRYFKEIALGFENGNASEITRKWQTPMRILIEGTPDSSILAKVHQAVDTLNRLATDGFFIEIVENTAYDCLLFFGSTTDFIDSFPDAEDQLAGNFAIFNVWWNDDVINRARIFIDTERPSLAQQESLVLEEITQVLGLGKDSPRYPNSIFYERPNNGGFAREFAEIDKELVRLLYHPEMDIGLDALAVDARLREILANE
ncbi:MAG: DUF2927 domain-containing protein [Bacteroidetes bacterium]|nr:MAG: DUF2927 domain-containing protein [Bacteroidota bacterium]